jgi:hypothetical protein
MRMKMTARSFCETIETTSFGFQSTCRSSEYSSVRQHPRGCNSLITLCLNNAKYSANTFPQYSDSSILNAIPTQFPSVSKRVPSPGLRERVASCARQRDSRNRSNLR